MNDAFQELRNIARQLRAEGGCPWDRQQTLETMKALILEEAGEVGEALDKKDHDNLEEELGDLLFCLMMTAQIAEEQGLLDMDSVCRRMTQKLIARHTWVFGEDKVDSAEEALALWKKNKAAEAKKK